MSDVIAIPPNDPDLWKAVMLAGLNDKHLLINPQFALVKDGKVVGATGESRMVMFWSHKDNSPRDTFNLWKFADDRAGRPAFTVCSPESPLFPHAAKKLGALDYGPVKVFYRL